MNKIILLFCLVSFSIVNAQELPPIELYTSKIYKAENQNWMISQSEDKYIYIANSGGLLEYDGAEWNLYPSPNSTIIRAVNVINNIVYTGCFEDFGFWKKDNLGKLKYHSLVSKLENQHIEDEDIWSIVAYKEWIVFHSHKKMYFYNTKTEKFKVISSNNSITKVYVVNNSIYYHVINEGLYIIEKGNSKIISWTDSVKNNKVINMFNIDGQIILQTRNSGFFKLIGNKTIPWDVPINTFIKDMSIYNSIQLDNGNIVLGTISDGVIYINNKGEIIYQINQKNGLNNNTVLSLFEDYEENLWLGLDNGINCINTESAIRLYHDQTGEIGTVYSSIVFNKKLYLGTNQGLFYRDTKDSIFKLVNGTSGQVWNLFIHDNKLFCGHNSGSFVIENNNVYHIDGTSGSWGFRAIPNKENLILQGNYDGLYILIKEDGKWKLRNKIEGFGYSARYFEINDSHTIWVSHEYKGVFMLKLDSELKSIMGFIKEQGTSISKNSSIIKYNNDILYNSEKGILKYDTVTKSFKIDTFYSSLIEKDNYTTGKFVIDENNQLWVFSRGSISYTTLDLLTNKLKYERIFIPSYLRNEMVGYENISLIENSRYLLGTTRGYMTIDISKINNISGFNIALNSIIINKKQKIEVNESLNNEFDYKHRSLKFNYSVPEYKKHSIVKYQYKLVGLDTNWNDWSEKTNTSYENLTFGEYTFKVKAKIGNEISTNIISYNFIILKPWYLSVVAIVVYILLLLIAIIIIHKAYKAHYNKQLTLKEEANEKLLIRIKNNELEQDIESKNRELAISTMSNIKKNEILNSIKRVLKGKTQTTKVVNNALKLIDDNINNKKDWDHFEEVFNNTDKHFIDKIKSLYPDLTSNDLRFCTYLRLNLSSKEIAPLLNISVRSVEVKRYRLRKKINLEHTESLTGFILNI